MMNWDLFDDDIPISPSLADEFPEEKVSAEINETVVENASDTLQSDDLKNDWTNDATVDGVGADNDTDEEPLFSTIPEDELPEENKPTIPPKRVIQPQLTVETFFRKTPDTNTVEKDALWDLYTLLNTKRKQNFPYCENEMSRQELIKKNNTEDISSDFFNCQEKQNTKYKNAVSSESSQLLRRLKTEKSKDLKMNLNLLMKTISNFTQDIYPYNESLEKFSNRLDKISMKSPMFLDYRMHLLQKYKNDRCTSTSPHIGRSDEPVEQWPEFEGVDDLTYDMDDQKFPSYAMEEDGASVDWNDDWMGVDEPFDNENIDLEEQISGDDDLIDSAALEEMKAAARNRLKAKHNEAGYVSQATIKSPSSFANDLRLPENTHTTLAPERIEEDDKEEPCLSPEELQKIEIAKAAALERLRKKQEASKPVA